MRKPPTVRIESRGGKAMTFFVPLWFRRSEAREFRWKGRLLAFSVASQVAGTRYQGWLRNYEPCPEATDPEDVTPKGEHKSLRTLYETAGPIGSLQAARWVLHGDPGLEK